MAERKSPEETKLEQQAAPAGADKSESPMRRASEAAKAFTGEGDRNIVYRSVSGTVHTAGDLSKDVVFTVRDLARDTLGAVGSVGNAAVGTARDLLVGVVGGMRDVVGAAIPRRYTGGAEQHHQERR